MEVKDKELLANGAKSAAIDEAREFYWREGIASLLRSHSPLPIIQHMFRPSENRSFSVITLVFSVLSFLPLVVLLIGIQRLFKANSLKIELPKGSEWLYAFVFQVSILCLLLSITLYWLFVPLLQALSLLAVCGFFAIFSGASALRMIRQREIGSEKKKSD
jgi:hypothetical protein